MGKVKKIGDEYFIEFYARGLLYQQKGGKDFKKAQALLKEIEDKIQQGEMGTIVRDVDVDVFFETFKDHNRDKYPLKTFQRYLSTIGHFYQWLGLNLRTIRKLSQITPSVIEQYRSALIKEQKNGKIKPKKINLTLLILKDVFRYGITLGYINDNPCFHAKWVEVKHQYHSFYLKPAQQDKIIDASSGTVRQILPALFACGLTEQEVVSLSLNQIDRKNNLLKLPSRQLPIRPDHMDILIALLEGHIQPISALLNDIKNIFSQHGLRYFQKIFFNSFVARLAAQDIKPADLLLYSGLEDIAKLLRFRPC